MRLELAGPRFEEALADPQEGLFFLLMRRRAGNRPAWT
jgi:hypothetical protein